MEWASGPVGSRNTTVAAGRGKGREYLVSVKSRRIKHFLRLNYPLRVVRLGKTFRAEYPDLAGCRVAHSNLAVLYCEAEAARRQWITESVLIDAPIPLPNSFLDERQARPPHRSEETTGSGNAP
jgi:hypothetical protein